MDRIDIRELSPLQIGYGLITKKLELCDILREGYSRGEIRYFKLIALTELRRQLQNSEEEEFGGIEDLPGVDGKTVAELGLLGDPIPRNLGKFS